MGWYTLAGLSLLLLPLAQVSAVSDDAPGKSAVALASQYVGYQEKANNRGAFIDTINRFVGAPVGSPYCASFVSWVNHKAGAYIRTRSAASRAFALWPAAVPIEIAIGSNLAIPVGSVLVWRRNGGGHVGFVERSLKTRFWTIEANTSSGQSGSQWDGGGIWRRVRVWSPADRGKAFRITHVVLSRAV